MNEYEYPLATRYASEQMVSIFSEKHKVELWRVLWCALAEAEQKLGLPISDEQLDEMLSHVEDADLEEAHLIERETHHDVMAHIRHFGNQCPKAVPIIHLGATSCFVTDNADILMTRTAAYLIWNKLGRLIRRLEKLALEYKSVPTLAYTHFQPAQPTTVGKRAAMWTQDFMMDSSSMAFELERLHMLGCKGATGTADSFLKLFDGDESKVRKLEHMIMCSVGAGDIGAISISGQTYTRKQDFNMAQVLSGIAQSASKMATDIRLLSGLREMWEPFGKNQVGSSAMPYKKNPMLCERVCGLARYVICAAQNTAITAATQWLERTLDDSSNRRLVIPELFMATDAILDTLVSVVDGLVIDKDEIKERLDREICYMIMESILMEAVKKGGDRQKLHEKLRKYSMAYSGAELLQVIKQDEDFNEVPVDYSDLCGMAAQQVERFFNAEDR